MSINKTAAMMFVCASLLGASGVPIGDMTSDMLGIEYCGSFSGQTITKAEVPSRFQAHYFMMHYAPIPYLLISAGIGGSVFETDVYDSSRFSGDADFSPSGGLTLYSPELARMLKAIAGFQVSLINSSDDEYRYSTIIMNPQAGLIFAVSEIFDAGAGVKGHILNGTMKLKNSDKTFSNNNYVHGYIAATLHSMRGMSYATVALDISPQTSKDWSFGPNEACISMQVGFILKPPDEVKPAGSDKTGSGIFRDLDIMREQQEKMADKMKEKD